MNERDEAGGFCGKKVMAFLIGFMSRSMVEASASMVYCTNLCKMNFVKLGILLKKGLEFSFLRS